VENDLAYFRKTSLFNDFLFVIKGVWVTLSGIVNWRRLIGLHLRILVIDVLMIEAAFILAHFTRYSGLPPESEWQVFMLGIWFLPPFLIAGMAMFGCYRNPVRYFYIPDALRLITVSSFLWLVFFIVMFSIHRSLSLYIIPLVWAFLIIFLMSPRVAIKFYWQLKPLDPAKQRTSSVLIYGAGRIGTVLSGLINGRSSSMRLVGFVDDNPHLRGRRVYGYEVLGRESDIPTIYSVDKFEEIWMTFKPDDIKRARLVAFCQKNQIRMSMLTEMEPFSRIFNS